MKYFKTIGVIGHLGMVGGTSYRFFKDQGYKVYGHDPRDPNGSKEKTFNADLIFICVPTPFNWKTKKYDDSIVENVISQVPASKTVVIKSTIHIGTTDRLQKKYPKIKILFNPEFLSEATCDMDFRNPDRQFVGYTKQSFEESNKVLNTLPLSPYNICLPAKEAELLKYINNMHGTLAVMESNHYFEVCQKEKLDYERVIKAACASKYMNPFYHEIFHKGFRGFGGKCFPKDINSWLEYLQQEGIDDTLFKAVRDMNRRILKEQNLTESDSEKK